MEGRFPRTLSLALAALLVAVTASAYAAPIESPEPSGAGAIVTVNAPALSTGPARYIVRLEDAPLASYQGGVPGFDATSPAVTGQAKLEAESAQSLAYRDYLVQKQDALIATMAQQLGHPIEVTFRYDVAFNGFAAILTGAEAAAVASLPEVVSVHRVEMRELDTNMSVPWIGAPDVWAGIGSLPGTQGEGMLVGVIDTGINHDHPSFADVGADGYNHTNPLGAGVYKGYCVANPSFCNDKLIGAYSYVTEAVTPEDSVGHGSHTASTAAGNHVNASKTTPSGFVYSGQISGVAPHANLIMYDACVDTCPSDALLAAVNQAVADGVDVINYSISGGEDPYNDVVEQAFLAASNAGVFVAASAGNDGPDAATVNHRSPWVASIAAVTHNRRMVSRLINMSGGNTPPPANIAGESISTGHGPAPIVYAGSFGDPLCRTPFAAGTWTHGEIVVCDRGINARVDKGANVQAGGAGGFVLANDAANGNSLTADAHYLPAVHITYADGVRLKGWLASGTGHTATIEGTTADLNVANGDLMASFSSRGPNNALDVLKPDIAAPGVAVFAAVQNGVEYDWYGGTSMASPHIAGAAALLMDMYPTWTPAEIKSALMTTAITQTVLTDDGVTPAGPFDMGAGSGRVNRAARAGLVFNETGPDYTAANPATGGDPTSLNLPSLYNGRCDGVCSWTRTARSTLAGAATWTATVDGAPDGVVITVTPATIPVAAGGTASFNVSADLRGFNATLHGRDGWAFAWVNLTSPGQIPLHLPVAVRKAYASHPDLLTKHVSSPLTHTGTFVEYTITLANPDPVAQTFTVVDQLPPGVTYVEGSATGGLVYNAGTRQLTWTGTVDPGGLDYAITPAPPLPYVNLGTLGAAEICTTYFAGSCDDKAVDWNLGTARYTFYGETLSHIIESSNSMLFGPSGWLGQACPACPQFMPNPVEINQVMAGLWRDTDASGGRGGFYGSILTGLLPNVTDRVFYANWHNIAQYANPAITTRHAIAVVLDGQSEPAGRIYYIYDDYTGNLDPGGYAIGVENKTGTLGTTYAFRQCTGGACIPHTPVGALPAEGTTLMLDRAATYKTFTYRVQVTATAPALVSNRVTATSGATSRWATADVSVVDRAVFDHHLYLPIVFRQYP